MQMILKSMGVKVDKEEMDGYAAEMDEEAAGKFTFEQFCQVFYFFKVGQWF
jgi:Ca2+-binding EF-hand superfamily protein